MAQAPRMAQNQRMSDSDRRPAELILTLRKDDGLWTCELHFRGDGWEAVILRDAELSISRRFILREQAIAWSDAEREHIDKGGA